MITDKDLLEVINGLGMTKDTLKAFFGSAILLGERAELEQMIVALNMKRTTIVEQYEAEIQSVAKRIADIDALVRPTL